MSALMLSECARATGGLLLGPDAPFVSLAIDSRRIVPGQVYLALSGERHDGHQFVRQAVAAGAVAAVVETDCGVAVPQLIVRHSQRALGDIARQWRRQFSAPLVAITGSNGKTTVKEMVAAILGAKGGPVLATEGNLNNEIGVPLTLLRQRAEHRAAVVEMGAARGGDIALLARIAEPDVAVVNNVGPAHLAGFGDLAGVALGKGEIYEGLRADGVAVINADEAAAADWAERAGAARVLRYGFGPGAELRAQWSATSGLSVSYQGCEHALPVALPGAHNARNALTAAAVSLAAGAAWPAIVAGLAAVQPVAGRLVAEELGGVSLVDDSYNANPGSVQAALDWLAACGGRRWFVLGTMAELGPQAAEMHARVGRQAAAAGIDCFLGVGEFGVDARRGFGPRGQSAEGPDEAAAVIAAALRRGDTVLVKGSRSAAMERVVDALRRSLTGVEA